MNLVITIFQIDFTDGHSDGPLTNSLSDVPVVPVESDTMYEEIYPDGKMRFVWEIPTGAGDQNYEIRIRSENDLKEYYRSNRVLNEEEIYASFWDLRGLEFDKTYQWFYPCL